MISKPTNSVDALFYDSNEGKDEDSEKELAEEKPDPQVTQLTTLNQLKIKV